MISRFRKLLVLFLVVSIAAAIIVLNLQPITVHYAPSKSFTAVGGLVLLGVFALGISFAAFFWMLFGIRAYFRERGLQNKDKARRHFYDLMLQAREYAATHEWTKAKQVWEQLIKKDPTHVIARIELSRSLERAGELREALKVIDAARADDPTNIEVLFRAAELNQACGNNTAAIDNLALVLYNHPNARAAEMARDLSEKVARLDDALEYHVQFRDLAPKREEGDAPIRLQYKVLQRENKDKETRLAALRKFSRRHPNFVPALQELAELEEAAGNTAEAAQCLVNAARISGSHDFWLQAVELWLAADMGDRALSAARSATRNTTGVARIEADLNLIRLYIALDKYSEAEKALSDFLGRAESEDVALDQKIMQKYLVLKGYCLNALTKYSEAAEVWRLLSDQQFALKGKGSEKKVKRGDAPSPSLSTP